MGLGSPEKWLRTLGPSSFSASSELGNSKARIVSALCLECALLFDLWEQRTPLVLPIDDQVPEGPLGWKPLQSDSCSLSVVLSLTEGPSGFLAHCIAHSLVPSG